MKVKAKWKSVGLWCGLAFEVFFWAAYLSALLAAIGSPAADVIWLVSAVLGIFFGVLNLPAPPQNHIRLLSVVSITVGGIQLLLWIFAILLTTYM